MYNFRSTPTCWVSGLGPLLIEIPKLPSASVRIVTCILLIHMHTTEQPIKIHDFI